MAQGGTSTAFGTVHPTMICTYIIRSNGRAANRVLAETGRSLMPAEKGASDNHDDDDG
jgi:hypothetical protein